MACSPNWTSSGQAGKSCPRTRPIAVCEHFLLDDAGSLASALNRRSTQVTQLRTDQNQVVSSQVDQINSLAGQVAQLNGEISRVLSVGEQPNDLMDKRDLALDQLSELAGAVSFDQKNGETSVSINGHVLVVGHDAFQLHTRPAPRIPAWSMSIGMIIRNCFQRAVN